ncbi:MAG: fibrobacter succinogenes major paralogous domain-containing protein [Bacteroidales bacterium]|jgi:uncharacterized protein (TIGR02145 family)|nr:fibrobacter succinogenes major paralogous domain-containing protein [Bacteroidales bacterium]
MNVFRPRVSKRIIISIVLILTAVSFLPAQTNILKVYKNNSIVFQRAITAIDSIIFVSNEIIEVEGIEINGVIWATRNVGAPGTFVTNPEDAGMFYQWNRNIGWSATDPMINTEDNATWNTSIPLGNTWQESNNVCPTGWRLPTQAESQSLTSSSWTTINGVTGRRFGTEPNTIFLPAAGYRFASNGSLYVVGGIGFYWTSAPYGSVDAYNLVFNSAGPGVESNARKSGYSVRCVAQTNNLKVYKNNNVIYEEAITAIDSIIFVSEEVMEGVEIDGVIWATCNVDVPGTFVTNPENAGMLYQWNRNIGWSSTNPMINTEGGITWDTSLPTGNTWEENNNVCPNGWRVPTQAELQSLEASGSTWTTINGKTGRIFGTAPNTIFLPAAGYRGINGSLNAVGTYSDYWSSTSNGSQNAYDMYFSNNSLSNIDSDRRYGLYVRCVAE